eukprot:TRINITY_DN15563_c0_g1_i1.p1 TRINITY_DN15563_c0_g1~~TRINITY_DN15563_c0_g1_i1.p1  ORF type:complete len:192 (-),score=76.76 TRINITY_DN15563_c0_g1_i1:61-636(-)
MVGLLFTLKTHTHIYEEFEDDGDSDHAPEWTRTKCLLILVVSIVLFAGISDLLVASIKPTLDQVGLPAGFVGVTVIALVPNIAEFVNAIRFAIQNSVSMSIEIGNTAAVQITLLQIPVLVLISAVLNQEHAANSFTLIFPQLDVIVVLFAVILINYITIDGRSNYFIGSSLVLTYALLITSFLFVPAGGLA